MDYRAYFFWNHLISVTEERRIIDGKEEVCLVIPTKTNQMRKGKQGNWFSVVKLAESFPNPEMRTHDIMLTYVYPEDLQKSYDFGYHKRTMRLGRVYPHGSDPDKKVNRENRIPDICIDGIMILSDIPKELIVRNGANQKRYIQGLTLRGTPDTGIIYCGSICVDDIPRDDIQTNPDNGKKYINTRLRKLPRLDVYMNTHELIITRPDGTAVQIGLFREFHSQNGIQTPPPQAYNQNYQQPSNQRQTPDTINGIRF